MISGNDARAALLGAVAGALGTATMTPTMRPVLTRGLPRAMRPREFPPRKAVRTTEAHLVGPDALSREQEEVLAWPAHFGYGCTWGAVYGLLRDRTHRIPPAVAGAGFGMAVWAAGYAGWLPAMGVRETTTAGPPEKVPVPLVAHVIYGVTTAMAYEALDRWPGPAVGPEVSAA